jgi:hypothetical protein
MKTAVRFSLAIFIITIFIILSTKNYSVKKIRNMRFKQRLQIKLRVFHYQQIIVRFSGFVNITNHAHNKKIIKNVLNYLNI